MRGNLAADNIQALGDITAYFASEDFAVKIQEFLERYKQLVVREEYQATAQAFIRLVSASGAVQDELGPQLRKTAATYDELSRFFQLRCDRIIRMIDNQQAVNEDLGVLSEIVPQLDRFRHIANGADCSKIPGGGLSGFL